MHTAMGWRGRAISARNGGEIREIREHGECKGERVQTLGVETKMGVKTNMGVKTKMGVNYIKWCEDEDGCEVEHGCGDEDGCGDGDGYEDTVRLMCSCVVRSMAPRRRRAS